MSTPAQSSDASDSSKIYSNILNSELHLLENKGKKKEGDEGPQKITLQDIVKCNAGNLKFGSKALLYVKKGVWLNSKNVKEILEHNDNLEHLNNIAGQLGKIQLTHFASKEHDHTYQARETSDQLLTALKNIEGLQGTINFSKKPETGGGEGKPIGELAERFYDIAHLPDPQSVIRTPNSNLRKAFLSFLKEEKMEVKNNDDLKKHYANFVQNREKIAIASTKEDLKSGDVNTSPHMHAHLAGAGIMSDAPLYLEKHEIRGLNKEIQEEESSTEGTSYSGETEDELSSLSSSSQDVFPPLPIDEIDDVSGSETLLQEIPKLANIVRATGSNISDNFMDFILGNNIDAKPGIDTNEKLEQALNRFAKEEPDIVKFSIEADAQNSDIHSKLIETQTGGLSKEEVTAFQESVKKRL